MTELLRCPTPELTHALGELMYALGEAACDTGVVGVTGVWRESKVIRLLSIIHNGIILDLECGFRW